MDSILILAILILLSAFFSGVETALVSMSNLKIKYLVDKGKKGATILQKLKHDTHKLLTTLLLSNNLVNIAASAIATSMAIDAFGSKGVGIATGAMTFLVLVFGEITPKALATKYAEGISLLVAAPIYYLGIVLTPLIYVLDLVTKNLVRIFGKPAEAPSVTEEEVKSIITVGEEEGTINEIEKELIQNIFDLDKIDVREVMVPRTDMVIVTHNARISEAADIIAEKKHSRMPVCKKRLDKIIGIVNIKDVFSALKEGKKDNLVKSIMIKPYFVPENKKIDALLREFQKKKMHMAIVVDEHGGVSGLVTLEDLLEEIVGEIYDESESVTPMIRRLNRNTYSVKGKTEIDLINKKLKLGIKKRKDFETISGYFLDKTGKIPKMGDKVASKKFDIFVEKMTGNRVTELKIIKK